MANIQSTEIPRLSVVRKQSDMRNDLDELSQILQSICKRQIEFEEHIQNIVKSFTLLKQFLNIEYDPARDEYKKLPKGEGK